MDKTEQKIVQYLSEVHATEQALVTALQSQIAMTPGGSYRGRITTLRDDEPWPGYDELSVDEVPGGTGRGRWRPEQACALSQEPCRCY